MSEAKPCSISKQEVWEAYQKVKANHGAAGAGLAPILRAVLSLGAVSDHASTGPFLGPLGLSEIQEAAWSYAPGGALDRTDFPA